MLSLSMPYTAFHLLAGITLLYEYKYRQNKTVGDLFQREFSFLKDGGFIGPEALKFDEGLDGTNMVGKAIPTEIGWLYVELHKEEVPTDWLSTNPEKRSNLKTDVARDLGFQLANDGAFRSARKRVLWVDEQPQNNENGIKALEAKNIEVVTCKSTREALEEIKKQGFDVIITDLFRYEDGIQKNEAGYELIRALHINGIKAPVILSTTSPDNDDAHRRGFFAAVNTQLGVFEHVLNALQGT